MSLLTLYCVSTLPVYYSFHFLIASSISKLLIYIYIYITHHCSTSMAIIANKIRLKDNTELREVSDFQYFSFIELIACHNTDDLMFVPSGIQCTLMLRELSNILQYKIRTKANTLTMLIICFHLHPSHE